MFFGKKVTGPAEWLLVCLGNYGKQYENKIGRAHV